MVNGMFAANNESYPGGNRAIVADFYFDVCQIPINVYGAVSAAPTIKYFQREIVTQKNTRFRTKPSQANSIQTKLDFVFIPNVEHFLYVDGLIHSNMKSGQAPIAKRGATAHWIIWCA